MLTSSVSLKSIRSISCLLRVPVVVLMSSSFSTSSGSSSKKIIFSISRRLHIVFSSIFCTFPQEIVCISFPPVIEALYSFGFEENILHISEERHSLTQLGDRQYTWDLPRRGRPGCSGQERRWSGPAESEKKIQGDSHILRTRDASKSKYPSTNTRSQLIICQVTYDCHFGLRGKKLLLLKVEGYELGKACKCCSSWPQTNTWPLHLPQESIQWWGGHSQDGLTTPLTPWEQHQILAPEDFSIDSLLVWQCLSTVRRQPLAPREQHP